MNKYRKSIISYLIFILCILIPASCFSEIYRWDDFTKPFKEKMNFIDISSPAKVEVNLPEAIIENYKTILLFIDSNIVDLSCFPVLYLNDHKCATYLFGQINGTNTDKIKIKTEYLKPGLNTLHFENRKFDCIYFIDELRFEVTGSYK